MNPLAEPFSPLLAESRLSDHELLRRILGPRSERLIEHLLARFGNLHDISRATVQELCELRGMGPRKAGLLRAAMLAGQRALVRPRAVVRLTTPDDVFAHYQHLAFLSVETFWVLALNTKNCVLRTARVAQGSLNQCAVEPRDVFCPLVRHRANSAILLHNHPSGDPTPSPCDRELTTRMVQAGQLLGIEVVDHVVLGQDCFESLREKNPEIFLGPRHRAA